jgi:hypothetical protein
MTISRIEGGKIVEEWQSYANSSMMDQLGLAPGQQHLARAGKMVTAFVSKTSISCPRWRKDH